MTVLMSGINMYCDGAGDEGRSGLESELLTSGSHRSPSLLYVALGGLRSAIFNEVLQFVLIWGGALLVPILGLIEAGGWSQSAAHKSHNLGRTGLYAYVAHAGALYRSNPMGMHWTGIVFGLGFVISFGYWTTDFLVVQRVLAADNLRSARMAPIIGAAFKMAVPFIVILPGLLALSVLPFHLVRMSRRR